MPSRGGGITEKITKRGDIYLKHCGNCFEGDDQFLERVFRDFREQL